MKAKEVMQLLNISRQTLWRYTRMRDKAGRPTAPLIRFTKVNSNHYEYDEDDVYSLLGKSRKKNHWCVVYARVRSRDQREELDRQVERLQDFANSMGLSVDRTYAEIASGSRFTRLKRKALHSMLREVFRKNVDVVIVDSPDRLMALGGAEFFLEMFRYYKTRLIFASSVPVNPRYKGEIMQDLKASVKLAQSMLMNDDTGRHGKAIDLYGAVGERVHKRDLVDPAD